MLGNQIAEYTTVAPTIDYLTVLWKRRLQILAITLIFGLVSTAYVLTAQKWWQSEVLFVQAESKQTNGALAQLGGLASLAGINIGGASGSQNSLAVLKSRDFARSYIEKYNIFPELMKGKIAKTHSPDIRDAVDYFVKDVAQVTEDKKTGQISLAITWITPELSAEWANGLLSEINLNLKNKALKEAEQNIAYLKKTLQESNIPSMQVAIGKVIESEMQKLLLARATDEFAFKIIDKATVPKKSRKPYKAVTVTISTMLGFLLAIGFVIAKASWPIKPT